MLLTRVAWATAEERKAQQKDRNKDGYIMRIVMVGG